MDLPSHNSQLTSYSSFLSDQDSGSHTGDSFNGFDHQEAHRINNADKTDMLNHELEFDSIQKRLETFLRWPADHPVKPQELAAAGFYSVGMDDRVKCFKCDVLLRQWKAGDDPWNEHKLCRPRCPYILECESERDYEVTCSPVEASSNVQNPVQISFAQTFPRYVEPAYPEERHSGQRVEEVSGTRVSSYHDPNVVLYSERPQYGTQVGGYGYHEQPYAITHPVDVQTGFRDQQAYYTGRMQQFLGNDPRSMQYQRPEHQRTEVTKHVVVGQGSSQVHIVGSGAAVYQLNPNDKLYVQGGGQDHPQQVRSVRDLTPVYSKANQTSRLPSRLESSFTSAMEPSQYSRNPEETMPSRYHPPPSTASYAPNYTGQFAKQLGYGYSREQSSSEGKATVEGVSGFVQFQGGSGNTKYVVQQHQGLHHKQDQLTYSMNTSHESGVPKQLPFPCEVPGQTYYEPVERKVSNEGELLQENCYRPQRYPGTKSETREINPSQPPRETSRWQDPPGRSVPGSRRSIPFAAFPVKDPSLQPAQRPLIRHEDARHVTSSSDLASEHHRLTTFVDWPHDHPIRPWDLSAAGFYYLGTGDSVKCYKCGIALQNWDPTDTPWGEHQKWSPRCMLVVEHFSGRPRQREELAPRQSVTSQERYTTPQEAFRYRRPEPNQGPNDRQVPMRSGDPPVHGTWSRSEQFPARTVSSVVRPQNLPLEQQRPHWHTQPMATSQEEGYVTSGRQSGSTGESSSTGESGSTQDSHSCSPRGSTALEFNMERLAEMGFTQQQIDDAINAQIEATGSTFPSYAELVSALLERQGGQPTNRETRPQPTRQGCEAASPPPPIIIPTDITSSLPQENQGYQGRNCISAVTSPTEPVPDKNSLRRSLSAPATRSSESGEESLEEKLERMQEERTCKICMDAEVSVLFLPCGHLSCCALCANGMDLCPMCRAPIQEKIRTYLS